MNCTFFYDNSANFQAILVNFIEFYIFLQYFHWFLWQFLMIFIMWQEMFSINFQYSNDILLIQCYYQRFSCWYNFQLFVGRGTCRKFSIFELHRNFSKFFWPIMQFFSNFLQKRPTFSQSGTWEVKFPPPISSFDIRHEYIGNLNRGYKYNFINNPVCKLLI